MFRRAPIIALGLAALTGVGYLAVTAPADAAVTQTASCTDGGKHLWQGKTVWGDVYTDSAGVRKVSNDYVGFTSAASDATTVDYSVKMYSGAGVLLQTLTEADRVFNFSAGSTYLVRNPLNPPAQSAPAKVVVNLGDGNDGFGNCTMTFTQPLVGPSPNTTPTPVGQVSKVVTFIEENHSLSQMQSGMPNLYSLAQRFSYANAYYGIRHPSLPNYLAIAGGDTFGVADDAAPSSHPISSATVFGQALAKGLTAKTYAEGQTSNCQLGNTGRYAVKHNPWAYFTPERTACNANDVPETSFTADAQNNRLPNVAMVVPDLCNDAHDCSLTTADNWLKPRLAAVLASSDFTSGKLAVVVTADEDDSASGNKVLTVVLHQSLDGKHKVVSTSLNHYSLSRMLSKVSGSSGLRNAAAASDMATAFGLTVGPAPAPTATLSPTETTSATPTASPSSVSGQGLPTETYPGFASLFADDFTKDAPEGQFLTTYPTWRAYPTSYLDTSKHGTYDPGRISVHGGVMDMRIGYDAATGKYRVAAPEPRINGAGSRGQTYGRYAVRFKADVAPGYKTAWLLWPDSNLNVEGEVDFPEADLNGTDRISAYSHDVNGVHSHNACAYSSPTVEAGSGWHTAVIEWTSAGVRFLLDGVQLGYCTTSLGIPRTNMHWILQTETQLGSTAPPASTVDRHVVVDWVRVDRAAA